MKISTLLSYSGGFRQAAAEVAEFEKAGLDLVWVAEAYGLDGPEPHGLPGRPHRAGGDRLGHPAHLHPDPHPHRHDRGRHRHAVRRPLPPGPRARRDPRSSRVGTACPSTPRSAVPGRSSTCAGRCGPARRRSSTRARYYSMPLPPDQGTGLGKALKIIAHPVRPAIPIWVAALGEKNVAMTAEVADGWIPMLFMPEKARDVWGASLDAGRGQARPGPRPAADHRRRPAGHR